MRMPDSRIPKQVFLGQLAAGKRLQCGPVLRYKDALKVNLKQCGIDPSALGDLTQDRSAWRTLCHEAVTQFEDSRVEALEHKIAVRKGAQPRNNLSAWPCDSCPRVCCSHQRTHRWPAIRRFRRRSLFCLRSIDTRKKKQQKLQLKFIGTYITSHYVAVVIWLCIWLLSVLCSAGATEKTPEKEVEFVN